MNYDSEKLGGIIDTLKRAQENLNQGDDFEARRLVGGAYEHLGHVLRQLDLPGND
ncbi:hypothetical protein SVA_0939 [Sulfurifustis variabilis]|uniref:Uncharacterized protein n=1 Tax=Sulfurifustis variabilis TaxID=1675686 RepID=A0A1B4V1Y6_9GAMM|nr:hypothetical protein [Sulfurifustis variabilis]BAU47518.1 hypothetical protein SVA_0939 [Sulfurifustis variabilis]